MDLQLQAIAIVAPIVAGIVQALKLAKLPSNLAPIMALGVGILTAWVVAGFTFNPTIWTTGLIAGLVSQGLYDQIVKGKAVITGK